MFCPTRRPYAFAAYGRFCLDRVGQRPALLGCKPLSLPVNFHGQKRSNATHANPPVAHPILRADKTGDRKVSWGGGADAAAVREGGSGQQGGEGGRLGDGEAAKVRRDAGAPVVQHRVEVGLFNGSVAVVVAGDPRPAGRAPRLHPQRRR